VIINDVHGRCVPPNAVYHAALMLFVGGPKAIIIEMAPKALGTLVTPGSKKSKMAEDQYEMFTVTQKEGVMATGERGKVFKSGKLQLKEGVTLRMLADAWIPVENYGQKEWSPSEYNCQTFVKDMLAAMATDRQAMKQAITVLSHDSHLVTQGIMSTGVAGSVANAFGDFKYMFRHPDQHEGVELNRIKDTHAFVPLLDKPITGARLLYTDSGGTLKTFGTTSKASRMADFKKRGEQLRAYQEEEVSKGGAQMLTGTVSL